MRGLITLSKTCQSFVKNFCIFFVAYPFSCNFYTFTCLFTFSSSFLFTYFSGCIFSSSLSNPDLSSLPDNLLPALPQLLVFLQSDVQQLDKPILHYCLMQVVSMLLPILYDQALHWAIFVRHIVQKHLLYHILNHIERPFATIKRVI